jgi:hypothetical protein
MSEWLNSWMNGWMDEPREGGRGGEGWMNRLMDGQMAGLWMDGQMNK